MGNGADSGLTANCYTVNLSTWGFEMVKNIDGYYVDENGNKWDENTNSEIDAKIKSDSLKNCKNCINCSDCSDCYRCSDCYGFLENPQKITSPKIGSRGGQTTIYWNGCNVQVVCGCFRGDIKSFREKISLIHGGKKHESDYLKFCDAVESYMESMK